jgi:hypothetical protein
VKVQIGVGLLALFFTGTVAFATPSKLFRVITLTPQMIYTAPQGNLEGVGHDIIVRLTNISDQEQSGRVYLYGERLNVWMDKRNTDGDGRFDQPWTAPSPYPSASQGAIPAAQFDSVTATYAQCLNSDFCNQPSHPARATQAGDASGFRLGPSGTATSTGTVTFRFRVVAGFGGIHTDWGRSGLNIPTPDAPPSATVENILDESANIVNNRSYASALDGGLFCRALPERELTVTLPKVFSGSPNCSNRASGALEFLYQFGIRVEVDQNRGAVVGTVMYRTFALGQQSQSAMTPISGSIPLVGGKPF